MKRHLPGLWGKLFIAGPGDAAAHRPLVLPFLLAALLVVLVGAWADRELLQRTEDSLRRNLLQHVEAIARGIRPERMQELSFTAEDRERPDFQRLSRQMALYAEAAGIRSLYSITLRDGVFHFGPESMQEGDPYASPPGTRYEHPPPEFFEAYQLAGLKVFGPYRDEFGAFVTGVAPVIHPATGGTLALMGVDMEAAAWRAARCRARRVTGFSCLAMLLTLAGWYGMLRYRRRLPAGARGLWKHADMAACALLGLLLTAMAAWTTFALQRNERTKEFHNLARLQGMLLMESFHEAALHLESMERFFLASEYIDREEFRIFSEPLLRHAYGQGWTWMPRVPSSERAALAALAQAEGLSDFELWERNEAGDRVPAAARETYYPILYIEPYETFGEVLGFDAGADAVWAAALAEAGQTGLPSAADAVHPGVTGPGTIFAAQAVSSATQTGYVGLLLSPGALLERSQPAEGLAEGGLQTGLFQLAPGRPPVWITGDDAF